MKNIIMLILLVMAVMAPSHAMAKEKPLKTHTFEVGKNNFMLDGKPFIIKAAEIHYARIPREYWEHRIQMCKSLGMNTLCIYVFWNYHEMEEGKYDFSGQKDIAAFVRLAQKNGMYVIVRPGPYVCSEWEMGGLPWWLLKKKDIRLREQDPYFMESMKRFEGEVAKQLVPYTVQNGGPIIMVQVENEYGSYAENKPYISEVRDELRALGWDKTVMFQCDWSSNFTLNGLDDLQWTMNFGTGAKVLKEFAKLKSLRPDSPMMCSEFWSGWFDGWGRAHETRGAKDMVDGLRTMLENNISFSLYMTHGGTSFGQWAGANVPGYQPDCTSYDYDAPIDEQGAPTEKFHLLRQMLQGFSDVKLPAVPKSIPVISFPEVRFTEMAPLFENIPQSQKTRDIRPMETFNMGYGSMLYACDLPKTTESSILRITEVHDYAIVYVDGKFMGTLYRGDKENALNLPALPSGGRLEVFVEAMGRINYSRAIEDRKGLTEKVELIGSVSGHNVVFDLKNWDVSLLPFGYEGVNSYKAFTTLPSDIRQKSGYYRAEFNLKKTGDTYLDMSSWGKGAVWVNGHAIGRFWKIGPQQTLFIPGCWLKKGANEIVVMDILGPEDARVEGLSKPVLDVLRKEKNEKGFYLPLEKSTKASAHDAPGNDAAPGAK